MKRLTLLALCLVVLSVAGCAGWQPRAQDARRACDIVIDAVNAVEIADDAVRVADEAHALCVECARAIVEVNEADPMTVHPCIFECVDAVRDAVEAAQDVAGAVEGVE
jgi:hypothetical protein